MSDKNKGNPVSDKSKLWMEETLLQLMRTENYAEITIQQITDCAGLSRRTFYRNYSSKDDIIEGCFLRIWEEYRAILRRQASLALPNIARIFFTVMQRHVDFLFLMQRQGLLPFLTGKVDALLPPIFYETKGSMLSYPAESIDYALAYSTGGFLRILVKWLNDGAQKPPEAMAALVNDFISILNDAN